MRLVLSLFLPAAFALLACSPVHAQTIEEDWALEVRQHVFSIAISPDGKLLAVGTDDIHLFDLSGGEPKPKKVLSTRMFVGVRGLTFSPDARFLAFGGSSNKVHLWSIDGDPKELDAPKVHSGDTTTMAFSRDGKLLASGSNDRTIIIWNVLETNKLKEMLLIKQTDNFNAGIRQVAFTNNTQFVVANDAGAIRLMSLTKDGKHRQDAVTKLNVGGDHQLAVRPDGKTFAVGAGGAVGLSGALKGVVNAKTRDVNGIAWSPDGVMLATCGGDGKLCVFAGVFKEPKIEKDRTDRMTCVAFPQPSTEIKPGPETFLAVGTSQGKVYVYKIATGKKK